MKKCEICNREKDLTFHHFIPCTLHSNKKFKKLYETSFLKTHGINVCKNCHSTIHEFFTEKELGNYYNTKKKLFESRKFRVFVNWVKKQK
jgi:hypothetical protein